MLTRIYGTAFANKTDLENYLTMMEEAKKRDHRKLGKEPVSYTHLDVYKRQEYGWIVCRHYPGNPDWHAGGGRAVCIY